MIMGIDYGTSKVGIAIINERENTSALPVAVLRRYPEHLFYDTFTEVLDDFSPQNIVVGNPFAAFNPSKDDRDSFDQFLGIVARISKKKPILFSETGTTREAQHLVKNHTTKVKDDDALSASIMLDAYVQQKKHASVS